ncbi:hypothetical protein ACFQS2_07365 [Brachybacterium sp. GCM10030267]|uniref:hypothetical protein n=1 Tax=Brachybacterium sp. GCM10030267 TaxID=3273381 RepID=UPI003622B02F
MDVAAALCRHERTAVIVGLSAARLLQMPLPKEVESWGISTPVHVSVPGGRSGSDQVVRWHDFTFQDHDVGRFSYRQPSVAGAPGAEPTSSLRLSTRARTWRDLAQFLSHWRLVAVGDHLVRTPRPGLERGRHRPWCTIDELRDVCRGNHMQALRAAVGDIRIGADSPMETLLRLAFREAGLPTPEINTPLAGADGNNRITPDFQWPQYGMCAEYDGRPHDGTRQVERDIRRGRAVARAGFTEVRLYSQDTLPDCGDAVRIVRDELIRHGWRP